MKNNDQRDDKFIKDQWFDDYCFYKLVIEDDQNTPRQHTSNGPGCGYVVIGTLIVMIIIDSILRVM